MTGASAIGVPGCPELARCTASIANVRMVFTASWSIAFRASAPGSVARNVVSIVVLMLSPCSMRPDPIHDLRPVGAVLVRVVHVVDDGVLHLLLDVRPFGA